MMEYFLLIHQKMPAGPNVNVVVSGEQQGNQLHWNIGDLGLGAGGARGKSRKTFFNLDFILFPWLAGALDHHVERPLQPQHLQLLLWGRGGSVDHQVQSTNANPQYWYFASNRFTRDMLPYWYNQMISHKLGRTFQVTKEKVIKQARKLGT